MVASQLLAQADLCVKCGLCLPHCPTYRETRHEADGPRGRIALAQGLATGLLKPDAALNAHLDGCLSCRACESVCPAKVQYGAVLDGARTLLATPERTQLTRLMGWVLTSPFLRAVLRIKLSLLAAIPFSARGKGPLARLWRYRPHVKRLAAPQAAATGKVALFAGCMGDVLERQVLQDAAELLRATGMEVSLPPAQTCCGALYQHSGQPQKAAALNSQNAAVFAGCDTVLALTPGCGAALRDLSSPGSPLAKVEDLCAFLAARLQSHPLKLVATHQRIGVHVACTQAHVMNAGDALASLLKHIPGAQLLPLAPQSGCCGAAGTQFITQPAMADRLLAPKLDAVAVATPDVIASANIGCSLHFAAGLKGRGLSVPVVHPVSLVAQAWRAAALHPG